MVKGTEWDGIEHEGSNMARSCRVLLVEPGDECRGMDIVCRFPGVMFAPKAFPSYQKPEFPAEHAAIEDLLNFPFFISFHEDREWRGLSASTRNRIRGCR